MGLVLRLCGIFPVRPWTKTGRKTVLHIFPPQWIVSGRVYIHDGTLTKPTTNGLVNFDMNRAGGLNTPDELNFLDNGLAQVRVHPPCASPALLRCAYRCLKGARICMPPASGLGQFIGVAGRSFQGGALYQNTASQALWTKWMGWLAQYRSILAADLVHVRKPSGRSWDSMMHVDATAVPGEPRGFAIFFNPTNATVAVSTTLSVYYCGFAPTAVVTATFANGTIAALPQDGLFGLPLSFQLPQRGYDWVALA
jgi:hypothetical protein